MASDEGKSYMKFIKISINMWVYGKVKGFAKANDMSVLGAIRYIINDFFKGKPHI